MTQRPCSDVLVLCRRSVDWAQASWRDTGSHFARSHPLGAVLEQWQHLNPGTPFQAYRSALAAIASASWQSGGAALLRNPVEMDEDAALTPALMSRVRQASWVIPIDDDDWLSPALPDALARLVDQRPARLAVWDVLPLHVDADHCFLEPARTFLDSERPLAEQVILSCGYAIGEALMAELSDDQLAACLLHHGAVSSLLSDEGSLTVLPDVQAVLLRHPASAGSSLEPHRERRLFPFPIPENLRVRASWALQPLQALQLQHRSAAALAEALVAQAPPPEAPEPWLELPVGTPRLSFSHLQRLLPQQGLDRALAQAIVLEEMAAAVPISTTELVELEQQLRALWDEQYLGEDPQSPAHQQQWARVLDANLRQRQLQLFRELSFSQEVELRYLERKAALDQVLYSILQLDEAGLAEELYQQIREGEADFAALAPRHSLGREAATRGQIGPESLEQQHPELASRLRAGAAGQLWPPFEVEGVWVVLRLERVELALLDDERRAQLLLELQDAWMEERIRQILAGEPLPPLPLGSER